MTARQPAARKPAGEIVDPLLGDRQRRRGMPGSELPDA